MVVLSDMNAKANFVAVDGQAVLAKLASIPVELWNYKSQDASIHHIGPMAQDFAAAFGVGEDNTHISTVDADGVALAAIQGLYQENQQLKARLASVEQAQEHSAPARSMNAASAGLFLSWSVVMLIIASLALLLVAGLALAWMRLHRFSSAA